MANAFKCDITGDLHEGRPQDCVITLAENVRVKVLVERQITPRQWEQGHIGPRGAEALGEALKKLKVKAG